MCPPQPSFAHLRELFTSREYQSARSDPVGVNLRIALSAYTQFSALYQLGIDTVENSRLNGELGLCSMCGLDDDAERRPASAT